MRGRGVVHAKQWLASAGREPRSREAQWDEHVGGHGVDRVERNAIFRAAGLTFKLLSTILS
jgi:hypothetical protein